MKKPIVLVLLSGLFVILAACGQEKTNEDLRPAASVEYGDSDYEQMAEANNKLGINVMADLSEAEGGNIVLSPTSLFLALSMVYNGAEGETKEEIAAVLRADGLSPEEINRANASLMALLATMGEGIELNVANSIWVDERYELLEPFTASSEDYYNASVESIDREDAGVADRINGWVNDATNGKIEEMAPSPLPDNLIAMLLNAIYFNGDWQFPFDESLTEEQPFQLEDGTDVDVPLMSMHEDLPYLETTDFQAVSLPYGDGEMSMTVVLPAAHSSLAELKTAMTTETWNEWQDGMTEQAGTIRLPKFKLEKEMILNDTLQRLGMETAFDSADLSKMFSDSDKLYISEVKQKTFIDVNEQGTEAAAATSVSVGETSAPADPFEMTVDRPFFFTITDETSGVILFMGAIENPAE